MEEPKNFLVGIAACKSTNFTTCSCEKSKKVPVKERMFLQNQRSLWIGFIGCVDVPTLLALQNKAERKHYNSKKNLAKEEEESPDPDFGEKQLASAEEQEMVDLNGINNPDINFHYAISSTSQMRIRLPSTATVCDRYNLSDRAAAAITSAVLQDFGIVTEVDTSHVGDKKKLKGRDRWKDLNFSSSVTKIRHTARNDQTAIIFDGRKHFAK